MDPQTSSAHETIDARCVPCQRLNNMPFKYPEMEDLPECRVRKARPFEHTGPISIKEDDVNKEIYGIVVTCTTTRLLHLELVSDMSRTTLLHALRRLFARRAIPRTIISDNRPYFLLAEEILRDAVLPVVNDVSLAITTAIEGIIWKTIISCSPRQGAFYERLVKSVKHSLYKLMRGANATKETLETLLVEVEGTLNCRFLTYQEEH